MFSVVRGRGVADYLSHPLPTPDVTAMSTGSISKLSAATARAQTNAAVGAVSLVAVLSYFMYINEVRVVRNPL